MKELIHKNQQKVEFIQHGQIKEKKLFFRIDSKNCCICGHGFNHYEKTLNKNNFSNKVKLL